MVIKEGELIKIFEGSDKQNILINKFEAYEDIKIENMGNGYTFIFRYEGCKENSIFESEKIEKDKDGYNVFGYFKDAILVLQNKYDKKMYSSYMDFEV